MAQFVGRKKELAMLSDAYDSNPSSSLFVIKGRRRIGKSRLVREFAVGKEFLEFSGLAPAEGIGAQEQRKEFANQLHAQLGGTLQNFKDWTQAFNYLAKELRKKNILFCLMKFLGLRTRIKLLSLSLKTFGILKFQKQKKLA